MNEKILNPIRIFPHTVVHSPMISSTRLVSFSMFSTRKFVQILMFVTDRMSILIMMMMMMMMMVVVLVVVVAVVVVVAGMGGRALTMEAVRLRRFGHPSCGQ
jgi:hypothetical protein